MNRPSEALIKAAIAETGGFRQAARYLRENGYDISESGIRGMNKRWQNPDAEPDLEVELPGGKLQSEIDVDALIDRRITQFARKVEIYNREKLVPVRCNVDGPIGLGFFGDMHLDDDGTDLGQVLEHVEIFDGRNEGLFASNLGDSWNNWVGRLARLYAEQSTSSAEALALVDEVLNRIQWLFYINGNHDVWNQGGDILKNLLASSAVVHKSTKCRLQLNLPSGKSVKIYAVHGFKGKSQWSDSYGAMKQAQLDGDHHDIYVGGHTHVSGYSHGMRPSSSLIYHALQVASYKKLDRYAEELNLDSKDMYNCPVALIDPYATNPMNFIRFEFDPHEGAERLKWMRARWRAGKTSH